MIYSELEAIGAEGSTDYGDYITTSIGKSTDSATVFEFIAIPDFAPFVYFKVGRIIQQVTVSNPQIVKVPVDGQVHQISDSVGSMTIYFDGEYEYSIKGSGSAAINFILYDVFYEPEVSLDDILSHLADINWPYPTGTIHYFDTSTLDLKNSLAGTPRYAGYDVGSGNECQTTTGYYNAAYCNNTYITSNALVWNSTNVDTSKANSYWINKTSTYIDIYLEFYAKTTITTANTWIIATINASIIDYKFSYDPVYFGCVMNDGSGTFSEVYMARTGNDGDTGNLEIRGVGSVAKGKGTGIGTDYLTYVQIRLLPNSYNSSEDYDLRSTGIGQTIVSS